MKAAMRISHGHGGETFIIEPGEEIPEEFLSEIPDHLILEKLSSTDPDELSRNQLMMLAGVGPYSEDGEELPPHQEMNEEDVRDALGNLRSKADLVDWMKVVRPNFNELDPGRHTREVMTNLIVIELTGDPNEEE